MAKGKELAVAADAEQLALLRDFFPVEESSFNSVTLPRISFVSQDKTEESKNPRTGKKEIKVVVDAGTFFFEKQKKDDEGNLILDEATNKPIWEKEEIGSSLEGIIIFQRKQLKMYDETTDEYTNSAVYDKEDEIIPIWTKGKEVGRGTPAELKAKYEYTGKDGKKKSALQDNRILYVLIGEEVFQLNLRGSSMYEYFTYNKTCRPSVPGVLTNFSSELREKGEVSWNMMTFTAVRPITKAEATLIINEVTTLKQGLEIRREQFEKANKA